VRAKARELYRHDEDGDAVTFGGTDLGRLATTAPQHRQTEPSAPSPRPMASRVNVQANNAITRAPLTQASSRPSERATAAPPSAPPSPMRAANIAATQRVEADEKFLESLAGAVTVEVSILADPGEEPFALWALKGPAAVVRRAERALDLVACPGEDYRPRSSLAVVVEAPYRTTTLAPVERALARFRSDVDAIDLCDSVRGAHLAIDEDPAGFQRSVAVLAPALASIRLGKRLLDYGARYLVALFEHLAAHQRRRAVFEYTKGGELLVTLRSEGEADRFFAAPHRGAEHGLHLAMLEFFRLLMEDGGGSSLPSGTSARCAADERSEVLSRTP
jgi:hypothetical protein